MGRSVANYSLFDAAMGVIAVGSVGIAIFDILRKTVFLGAWWNYQYPSENLVYDIPVLLVLIAIIGVLSVFIDRLLESNERRFILILHAVTISLSILVFFATPLKSTRWIEPTSGYFYAATVAANHGPIEYFRTFHGLGTPFSTGDNLRTAQYLTSVLRSATFLPGHGAFADYASNIVVQKHGPIPPLMVSPFIAILGETVGNASIGSYAFSTTIPVIGYLTFREYFTANRARFGAILLSLSPGYLIYQRFESVAWDAITAFFVALSVYLFLRWYRTQKYQYLLGGGVIYSLAYLSKISAAALGVGYVIVILFDHRSGILKPLSGLAAGALVVPIGLLFLGYNFVIQFLFSIARLMVESSSTTATDPAAYLNNPLLNILGPLYNARLLGPVILVAGAFIVVVFLSNLIRRRQPVYGGHRLLATSFLMTLVPFVIALPGRTISRHLLPYIVPIVFVTLCSLDLLIDCSETEQLSNTFIRVSIVATGLVLLPNI